MRIKSKSFLKLIKCVLRRFMSFRCKFILFAFKSLYQLDISV
nr:hypothetical protein [Enterococcus casseliflavus]